MAPPEHIKAIQRLRLIIQERNGTSSEGAQKGTITRSEGAKIVTPLANSEGAKTVTPTTTKGTQPKRTVFPILLCITQEEEEKNPKTSITTTSHCHAIASAVKPTSSPILSSSTNHQTYQTSSRKEN